MLLYCLGVAALVGLCALTMVEPAGAAAEEKPVVVIDTTAGPITIELDQAKAPVSVDNFLKYVEAGHYNGTIFHRVIDGFMIQGGGFDQDMREKKQGLRPPIKNEASNGLSNARGTIAMARTNDPNSATAQFYINLVDNARGLDPRPGSAGYAVFGRVIDGMDAVDAIAKVQTTRKGPYDDVPVKPIVINGAKRKGQS